MPVCICVHACVCMYACLCVHVCLYVHVCIHMEKRAPPKQYPQAPVPFSCVPSVLEVHQFAQEAVVADAWLTAQEPILQSAELGSSVDEVEQLIRRHEAFRKAAAAWEERFSSLRRLTTVSTPHLAHSLLPDSLPSSLPNR